jgi:hypothetical protein
MNAKLLFLIAVFTSFATQLVHSADAPKKAPAKKSESKADQSTYPFYGKVTAITSRTLTIVRGESAEAAETKFSLNAATEYVNGDKPSSFEAVKVGSWVGGAIKKATGEGNDTVLKLNVGVKQKAAEKDKPKSPAKKKEEPKKKADAKKKSE